MANEKVIIDKGTSFIFVHKLVAGVSILMFLVILINGIKVEASLGSIVIRSVYMLVVVGIIARVVIKVLKTYQEMNSD